MGDAQARANLWAAIYEKVKQISTLAVNQERASISVAATDIAHEAYLKIAHAGSFSYENRAHLMATIARAIRRLLIDHARQRSSARKGGEWKRTDFDVFLSNATVDQSNWEDLDDALEALSQFDNRLAMLVDLRFFGGMTLDEAADQLGLSRRTIASDWALARSWLRRRLEEME